MHTSEVMPIIPHKDSEKLVTTSMRLSEAMVRRLDAISDETGRSRNEVIVLLLTFAIEQHEKEQKQR